MFALLESKEHWKYASGNQPVDMEWNKAEKCWQPMVFDDHDDDDDDDYLANNSGAETAASASAIEDNSAADVRRCVRRCGNCPGCRSKQDCGRCKMCKYKKEFGGPGSRGACIHRPCTGAKQRQQGARSSSTGGRKRPPAAAKAADHDDVPDPTVIPQNGDRVYCRWPENNVSR